MVSLIDWLWSPIWNTCQIELSLNLFQAKASLRLEACSQLVYKKSFGVEVETLIEVIMIMMTKELQQLIFIECLLQTSNTKSLIRIIAFYSNKTYMAKKTAGTGIQAFSQEFSWKKVCQDLRNPCQWEHSRSQKRQ